MTFTRKSRKLFSLCSISINTALGDGLVTTTRGLGDMQSTDYLLNNTVSSCSTQQYSNIICTLIYVINH